MATARFEDGPFAGEPFAMAQGELLVGFGVAIIPDEMAETLAAAARTAPGRPDDPRTFPVWTVVTTDAMPLKYREDIHVHRQVVLSADIAFALLGGLQAWCERARGQLPIYVADQLDSLRAEAHKRWRVSAAEYDRRQAGAGGV